MDALKNVFTEEQVTEVSDKILKLTLGKITNELNGTFYNEMASFLYEHYTNASGDIHKQLIKEIADQFIKEPKNHKFTELRKKLFIENKEHIITPLTDDFIEKNVESVILNHVCTEDYMFNWQWRDAVVKIVLANWDKFKDNERIQNSFGREIDSLKSQIQRLKQQLQEIQNIVE